MDLAEIKALALKAREWQHAWGECAFTMRTPTLHEIRQATHAHGLKNFLDGAERAMLQHHLVAQQCVGWAGVRMRHLVPGMEGGADPVPCCPDAVRLLQDAQPELAEELGALLMQKVQLRNAEIEVDAKNSQRTSAGPAPVACAI